MAKIERICPNCGTGNASDRVRCSKCGTQLRNLPATRANDLPAHLQGESAAALVLSATALLARAGLRLLVREVLPRVAKELATKPASQQIVEQPSPEQPDYVIRGWRVWSYRHGEDQASGSEHFEWRVNRRDRGGTGKAGE